jgi:hypothetical protein
MLLQPDASALLREQLLIELAAIATADEAAVWTQRKLPVKNTLTPKDADVIEQAFRARLQAVGRMEADQDAAPPPSGDQPGKFDAQPLPNAPNLDSRTGMPLDNTVISDARKLAPVEEEDQDAGALVAANATSAIASCVRNRVSSAAGGLPMPITFGLGNRVPWEAR